MVGRTHRWVIVWSSYGGIPLNDPITLESLINNSLLAENKRRRNRRSAYPVRDNGAFTLMVTNKVKSRIKFEIFRPALKTSTN